MIPLTKVNYSSQKANRGVALISMLLVFTIVAVMASDTALRLYMDIRRADYLISDTQALEYAFGGEALARQILMADFESDTEENEEEALNDNLQEAWSRERPPFQPDDGEILIFIEDLDRRFNINNLVTAQGEVNSVQLIAFRRLLNTLDLSSSSSTSSISTNELSNRIVDWLDSDTLPTGLEGEDQSYLGKEPGYRTANRLVTDTSELLAIEEFHLETYHRLSPFITALPEATSININTAPVEVLNTLHSKLDSSQVITARESLDSAFANKEEFLAHESTFGLKFNEDSISVRSQYFQIWVKASFNERILYLRSQVSRDPTSGKINLLGRSLVPPSSADTDFRVFLAEVASSNSKIDKAF